jgi:hypothetical protein
MRRSLPIDHHLARVQPHTDLHLDAVSVSHLLGVAPHRHLDVVGRVACSHRVILVGEGRAEERHDAVAHHLVDGALVAMDRLHHAFEDRIQELAGFLGVAVGEQLHRALQVREQDRDLLAFALEGALGGEDFLGEVLRGVGLRGGEPSRIAGRGDEGGQPVHTGEDTVLHRVRGDMARPAQDAGHTEAALEGQEDRRPDIQEPSGRL